MMSPPPLLREPDFAVDRNILWREALTTDIGGVWDITVQPFAIAPSVSTNALLFGDPIF